MNTETKAAIIGAIVGGILALAGSILQGLASYVVQRRRSLSEERRRWVRMALNWAGNDGRDSLRRAKLKGADLYGVNLGCSATTRRMREAGGDTFSPFAVGNGADLTGADLRGADLRHSTLQRATLRNARLKRANMQHALVYADLEDAELDHADLRYADLSGSSNTEKACFKGAKYNRSTLWPKDSEPPSEARRVC